MVEFNTNKDFFFNDDSWTSVFIGPEVQQENLFPPALCHADDHIPIY